VNVIKNNNSCLLRAIAFVSILVFCLPVFSRGQGYQDWSYNLAIYEVNVRQYSQEGTFEAFSEHLDRLKEMGVGILWFMPIHPIGYQNRLGTLGSYYSVRDYYDVNPEFGSMDEFVELVQAAHDLGMYVIIDWVANHTSWDNVLTSEHPEWYSTDSNGNFIPPPGTNWSDVIELDYSKQGLRDYMIDAMKFWVTNAGVDGFRCDAVSFVPQDFWREAITELKATKPDIFMLAEGEGKQWHDAGFDMTYGWGLYGFESGILTRIIDGTGNATSLVNYVNNEKATYGDEAYRMYFTSNHDENSWHGTTAELFGEAANVFSVLTATFNGMPLIYSGQEAALNKRLQFFDKDQIPWRDHENATLFKKLLNLKKENKALWNGSKGGAFERILSSNNLNILTFMRENDGDKVVAALNLSSRERAVTLSGTAFVGNYKEIFTEAAVSLDSAATLTLPPWGYQVYSTTGLGTSVAENPLPDGFSLAQNYPNPFNPQTTITYDLERSGNVMLAIYNATGQLIETLVNGFHRAGNHKVVWDATGSISGIYFYKITTAAGSKTKKMVLVH